MDSLHSDKVQLLQLYFPGFSENALSDLLSSCAGDLDATRALIDGKPPPKKRAQPQSSLPLPPDRIKKAKVTTEPAVAVKGQRSKIITLHTCREVSEHLAPYVSLHLNVISDELSYALMDDFEREREKFTLNQFYLFGNQCESSHHTASFAREGAVYPKLAYNGLASRSTPYSGHMEEVSQVVEKFINDKIMPSAEKHPFERKEEWSCEYLLVNRYEKLNSHLDWHSDRLSHIGPHSYVATLSMGATRLFRLRSTYKKNAPIYQIPLPHNSVLLMRPGCQEEFKHCVGPMSKPIDVHPKVGTLRYGLTLRHYPLDFIRNSPRCKCDIGMVLRRSFRTADARGKYFWSCENVYQNKCCGKFFWADFDNEEGHYVADDEESASSWVAPDDLEAQEAQKNPINGESEVKT